MELGAFSVSLTVKDIAASRAFYEALGFTQLGGVPDQGWLILRNGTTVIGLFQGMFQGNLLTFNPGWNSAAENIEPFTDVRDIHQALTQAGLEVTPVTQEAPSGPASFTVTDPDGNHILFDQHR
jgi:catechol 2,3-dioxygenase-like lactoylglutathione lyase family enzyme